MGNLSDNLQLFKDKDGNRFFIRRCNKNLFSVSAYRNCLDEEIRQAKELSHPNLPQYIGLKEDEKGAYIEFKYTPSLPIFKALLDTAFNINNKKDTSHIISQLIDVVSYLHHNGILHLNINPASIYVTKSKHSICLYDPLNTYIKEDLSFAVFYGSYSDPRLFYQGNVPDERCDIYSIGKIMEYAYSYSNITPWTRYIIKKATNHNITKRYKTVEELRKDFLRTTIADYVTFALKIAAAIGVLFVIYLGMKDEGESHENYIFREQTKRAHKVDVVTSNKATDSAYVPIDSLKRISPTVPMDSVAKAVAEDMFIKEFRKEASKVINKIYTTNMMNSTPEKFQKLSMEEFSKLDKLQKEMAVKYNMSFSYSTQLSSDVINELTEKRLKELK